MDLEVGDRLWSLVSENHLDVLGLTIGSALQVAPSAAAIEKARRLSLNPNIVICAGGYCAVADPAAMAGLGADFIAVDALDAIDTASSYLGNSGSSPQ